MKKLVALIPALLGTSAQLRADIFHYNNVLVGDRAMGLAGAYCGISDDAAGLVYNPAGIAFALSNDISGSANAIYRRSVRYKSAIGSSDFTESSNGTVPAFFGGLQKLDNLSPGLAFSFGIYATDAGLRNQDTVLSNETFTTGTGGSALIDTYHRNVVARETTVHYAAAMAKRFTPAFSMGFGLDYTSIDELFASNQYVRTTSDGVKYGVQDRADRTYLTVGAIVPSLGFQWAVLPRLAVGATVKKGKTLQQKLEYSTDIVAAATDSSGHVLSTSTGAAGTVTNTSTHGETAAPVGEPPLELRSGLALFASTRMLLSADVIYHGAASGDETTYERKAVIDYASGLEYYVIPSLPVRIGAFTNNDARPKVDEAGSGQPDHIDYVGGTMFLAWVQQNSQVSAGFAVQQGQGKAQKLGDSQTQDVVASSSTFAFSASHNF